MIVRTNISTISYNTDSFLIAELKRLKSDGLIYFWCFINHLPEDDEKKMHKHLFVCPATNLDTFSLDKVLQQIDVAHPDLPPLCCKMWVRSKFVDWFLYALHDKDYLAKKGIERKYHYTVDDVLCSDSDDLNELIHTSDFSAYKNVSKFRDMSRSDVPFVDLVSNGFVPIQQIEQYSKAYDLFKYGDMYHSRRFIDGMSQRLSDSLKKTSYKEELMPFHINEDGEILPD